LSPQQRCKSRLNFDHNFVSVLASTEKKERRIFS
jgi:hypothetical protein